MADVENPHAIIKDAIENAIRVSHQRDNTHSRPIDDAGSSFGSLGNMRDNIADACFDCERDRVPKLAAVGSYIACIGQGSSRILDFHACRN